MQFSRNYSFLVDPSASQTEIKIYGRSLGMIVVYFCIIRFFILHSPPMSLNIFSLPIRAYVGSI